MIQVEARRAKNQYDAQKPMGWDNVALQYLRVYCGKRRREMCALFIARDVREAAAAYGLEIPFGAAEWGPIFQKAEKLGLIKNYGQTPDPQRKYGKTALWLVA